MPGDLCYNAVLLTSELVSNVVRHGEVPARLEIAVTGNTLRVVVFDSSSVMPPQQNEATFVATAAVSLLRR